ncbi:MAG: MobC family plasmid mobilization relaxosome protein [Rhodobacteraceae bacterium]|nr:MobC family plasmid mobilization relaxosome protein [Paracoccaceae bacterium]
MRDRVLRGRVSEEELERWRSLASAAGMPLSGLVRNSMDRVRPWSAEDRRERAMLLRQLAGIGNNLNQIARRVNTAARAGGRVAVLAELSVIADRLKDIRGR